MFRMIKAFRFILVTLALGLAGNLFLVGSLRAQFSGAIDITFTSRESTELTVGDPVELVLAVTHPPGYRVDFPQLPLAWGQYEVRDQLPPETVQNTDGTETTSQVIVVTLFAPGTFQSPSPKVTIRDPNGEKMERVAPQLTLTVVPTLASDDEQLRDIKPQAQLPLVPTWPFILAGVIVTALFLYLLWRLLKRLARRLSGRPVPEPALVIDNRPPHVIALAELERIERLDLPGQGRFKEYYSLVTDCLRYYIGGRYRIPAIDMTTSQTKQALQYTTAPPEVSRRFIDLFTEGDLVKFARFVPDLPSSRRIIGEGRYLVETTTALVSADGSADDETTTAEPALEEAI